MSVELMHLRHLLHDLLLRADLAHLLSGKHVLVALRQVELSLGVGAKSAVVLSHPQTLSGFNQLLAHPVAVQLSRSSMSVEASC